MPCQDHFRDGIPRGEKINSGLLNVTAQQLTGHWPPENTTKKGKYVCTIHNVYVYIYLKTYYIYIYIIIIIIITIIFTIIIIITIIIITIIVYVLLLYIVI